MKLWAKLPPVGRCGIFLVILFSGCSEGLSRVAVHGAVKRENGESVEAGGVSFLPDYGHNGPAANGNIEEGEYRFTTEDGPTPGRYRVVISVSPSTRKLMEAKETGKKLPKSRTQWIRDVTVPPVDSFSQNFTLDD